MTQCEARVFGDVWSRSHQCARAGIVIRDGKHYCRQHDPVAKKEKADARDKKWEDDRARRMAQLEAPAKLAAANKRIEELEAILANVVLDLHNLQVMGCNHFTLVREKRMKKIQDLLATNRG